MRAELVSQIELRKAIEMFDADEDIDRLKQILAHFNIFDAVGPRWSETDHSACLAFLLDPQKTHGLRDTIARTLLEIVEVATGRIGSIPSDMTTATVVTEAYHVDTGGTHGHIDIHRCMQCIGDSNQ